MAITRRQLLRQFGTMTAAAIALPHLDLDQLIWTPKPIVVVPDMATALATAKAEGPWTHVMRIVVTLDPPTYRTMWEEV